MKKYYVDKKYINEFSKKFDIPFEEYVEGNYIFILHNEGEIEYCEGFCEECDDEDGYCEDFKKLKPIIFGGRVEKLKRILNEN